MNRTDVAVIGAGQAGLAMSACLSRAGLDHLVLERGQVGERWRSERRPGLRLLTPAWMMRLPGFVPRDLHPDSFPLIGAFADLLDRYAAAEAMPLHTGCEVRVVEQHGERFRLCTSRGEILARAVVVATGACDLPRMPSWARDLAPAVQQVTPDRYRHAADLPPGGVLVVGASATGMQIAAELATAGRRVTLAVGRHVRAPRRYRGRDLFAWLDESGFLSEPRPPGAGAGRGAPSLPLVGGPVPGGGSALELASLHAAGVRIVGRALGCGGNVIHFAQSVANEVSAAETRRRKMLVAIDHHIARNGHAAAPEPEAWLPPPALPAGREVLDLAAEGIRSVLWATGYRRAYPWLRLPVLGSDGEIVQQGGITPVAGFYVLGLPFMRHRSSALIDGVGRDAAALARDIQRRFGMTTALAA